MNDCLGAWECYGHYVRQVSLYFPIPSHINVARFVLTIKTNDNCLRCPEQPAVPSKAEVESRVGLSDLIDLFDQLLWLKVNGWRGMIMASICQLGGRLWPLQGLQNPYLYYCKRRVRALGPRHDSLACCYDLRHASSRQMLCFKWQSFNQSQYMIFRLAKNVLSLCKDTYPILFGPVV